MKSVGRVAVLSIAIVLAVGAATRAQDRPAPPGQAQATASSKKPPPPLFPKHRRGLYKNADGLEVIDATPQSPPLGTDDPSVPDKGEYEINLTLDADLSRNIQNVDLLFVDANYGILPKIGGHELPTQVKFEFPLAGTRESGQPFTVGVGAATFGLKINFFTDEHSGTSIAVYPQVEFGTPGAHAVAKGLADPGQTLILPLLVSKQFHYFAIALNGAVTRAVHDPGRNALATTGIGVGRALTRKVAAMIELRTESTLDFKNDRLVVVNGGLIHGVRNIVIYTEIGRSVLSDDGFSHAYVGGGIKLLIETQKKAQ